MINSLATEAGVTSADLHGSRRRQPAMADPSRVDRLPPHSIEAEQGVLGCVLLSPNECLGEYIQKFKDVIGAFYDLRHQCIMESLIEMYDTKEPIDLITLQQRLKNKNQLESVGGLAYLSSLVDAVPSAANLTYYLEIVREKYLLRRTIQACSGVVGRVYDYEGDVDALLDEVERDILHISEAREESESQNIKDLVHKAINTIEDFHQRQGMLTGISTGFVDLDKLTSGLHGGEMIVIAARPSMGKTALAMNIAEHVAINEKLPVAVFSLEMSSQQLVQRLLCSRARVNLQKVRDGFLGERDFPSLTAAASKLAEAKIFIDDSASLTILELRAKARRLKAQQDVQLIIVDYLQLLRSTSRRAQDNRQLEISEISAGLKGLAKELKIPLIVVAQLNRQPEQRTGGKPRLSDLRESGSIEQDADLVGLLVRPEIYEEDEEARAEKAGEAELIIAKQRNGPVGEIPLTFLKEFTRFETRARNVSEPEEAF